MNVEDFGFTLLPDFSSPKPDLAIINLGFVALGAAFSVLVPL
jgi:hypothetical protein